MFFSARIWIDFLRRSQPELVLGDRVQPLEVQDQDRPAAVQVGPELIHHQFFDIFAHDSLRPVPRRSLGSDRRGSAQAMTRMPGLMVAEMVTDRMYVPLAAAGLTVRRWFRNVVMFSSELRPR